MVIRNYILAIVLFAVHPLSYAMPFSVKTYERGYAQDCSNPKSFVTFIHLDKGIYSVDFNLEKNITTVRFFDEYQDLGNHWHLLRNNEIGLAYALTGSGLTLGKVMVKDVTVLDIAKLTKTEREKYKSEYCMIWTKGSGVWDKTWSNFLQTHPLGQRITSTAKASKEKTCSAYNSAKLNCATAGNIDRCIDIKMGWDNQKSLGISQKNYTQDMCKKN
jgi:hypothetical protein